MVTGCSSWNCSRNTHGNHFLPLDTWSVDEGAKSPDQEHLFTIRAAPGWALGLSGSQGTIVLVLEALPLWWTYRTVCGDRNDQVLVEPGVGWARASGKAGSGVCVWRKSCFCPAE